MQFEAYAHTFVILHYFKCIVGAGNSSDEEVKLLYVFICYCGR